MKRGRIFLNKDPLGEDRDSLRKRGEKVRMSLLAKILNKLGGAFICYAFRKWGWVCELGERGRLKTAAGGICWNTRER